MNKESKNPSDRPTDEATEEAVEGGNSRNDLRPKESRLSDSSEHVYLSKTSKNQSIYIT